VIGAFAALVLSVYDGDTFTARIPVWENVEVITAVRIRGIDTPEIKGKCPAERERAIVARERLRALLATGSVELRDVSPDKYAGRVDASVTAGGKEISAILIAEGLARPYAGGTRQGWCP